VLRSSTKSGSRVPPTAQHATREATTVAGNIAACLRGEESSEFDFEGLGKSRFASAAIRLWRRFSAFRVSGLPAWFLWRTIYLMKMPSLYRKVRIGLDWMIALFFHPDLVEVRDIHGSSFARQHLSPAIWCSCKAN